MTINWRVNLAAEISPAQVEFESLGDATVVVTHTIGCDYQTWKIEKSPTAKAAIETVDAGTVTVTYKCPEGQRVVLAKITGAWDPYTGFFHANREVILHEYADMAEIAAVVLAKSEYTYNLKKPI